MTALAAAVPSPRPSPYAVRDDALPADQVAELLAFTLAHEDDFKASKTRPGTPQDVRLSRVLPRAIFEAWRPRMETWVGGMMPGIFAELGMTPFPMSRLELQLVAHNDGDFFRTHIDTQIGAAAPGGLRLVSMVYYFQREPGTFDGGALRIFSLKSDSFVDVAPEPNRLVAFPSWVPHEVLPIACPSQRFVDSRFSINCFVRGGKPSQRAT